MTSDFPVSSFYWGPICDPLEYLSHKQVRRSLPHFGSHAVMGHTTRLSSATQPGHPHSGDGCDARVLTLRAVCRTEHVVCNWTPPLNHADDERPGGICFVAISLSFARHSSLTPRHSSLTPRHSSLTPRHSSLTPRHSSLTPSTSLLSQPNAASQCSV